MDFRDAKVVVGVESRLGFYLPNDKHGCVELFCVASAHHIMVMAAWQIISTRMMKTVNSSVVEASMDM